MRQAANKKSLSEVVLRRLRPRAKKYLTWDKRVRGLAVEMQPTGRMAWKFIYSFAGRARWFTIGPCDGISIDDARKRACKLIGTIADDKDPQAARMELRSTDTFKELHERYLDQHAKLHNKSWKQADYLIRTFVLPRFGTRKADSIIRGDVKELRGGLKPSVANQVLASISAIYGWAIKEDALKDNPCRGIDRAATKSRERVLADSEVPLFWKAFDDAGLTASTALKVLLLTGQRPGEVAAMRREHIVDGWWTQPGEPVAELKWPGTKNGQTHRVWLPHAAQELIAELSDATTGFVFASASASGPVRGLDEAMRAVCTKLKAQRLTPHDLRRTHGTTITKLGYGRDAMNRIQNHKEGGIASVYDRHGYEAETKIIMEAVANRIVQLTTGVARDDNVTTLRKSG